MDSRKKILIAAGIIIIVLAVIYGLMPKPVRIETASVERGPMSVTVTEEGRAVVTDRFVVSAPVSGHLRRIDLRAGTTVSEGGTLAVIEPLRSEPLDPRTRAASEAAVSAAEASLRAAREVAQARRAEAEYARETLSRTRELFRGGHVPRSEMDRVEAAARQAEAVLNSAEANVNAARSEFQRARAALMPAGEGPEADGQRIVEVKSPIAGRVLRLHRESEGAVRAGEPLIDIGNTGALEIRAEVLSSDAVLLRPGTPVIIERWGGGVPLDGSVRIVEPSAFTKVSSLGVEEQRVFVTVDILSPAETWERLGDGYRVETRFVVWEEESALKVPVSALFRSGDRDAVFVVDNGRARERRVEIGHRNGFTAEVLSGLSEGEEIVVNPDESLEDGSRITRMER
ncbi:MAG: HlyD family efflux transporter periplasmic adaptor subunit [Deltaproteobacteria bacterium]|nr:HlyD family efflux transporter periplasmic adaptor subunit [Deltaproteobacteria bacterium]MBZ0219957.1 HlyD family efflux transporter periplasmic adaptor subunit [Deltaproteobacteria bacterium]